MTSTSGSIDPEEGRTLFGIDPANYAASRPEYPDGGLRPAARSLRARSGDAGARDRPRPGPGDEAPCAGRRVDRRRRAGCRDSRRISRTATAPFGDGSRSGPPHSRTSSLPTRRSTWWPRRRRSTGSTRRAGWPRSSRLLRPGGWWAGWWNVFGDPSRVDAFHEATQSWLRDLPFGPSGAGDTPFPLDLPARFHDLEVAGFEQVESEQMVWTLTLTSAEVRRLYATYSPIIRLEPPRREEVLDGIARVADRGVRRPGRAQHDHGALHRPPPAGAVENKPGPLIELLGRCGRCTQCA